MNEGVVLALSLLGLVTALVIGVELARQADERRLHVGAPPDAWKIRVNIWTHARRKTTPLGSGLLFLLRDRAILRFQPNGIAGFVRYVIGRGPIEWSLESGKTTVAGLDRVRGHWRVMLDHAGRRVEIAEFVRQSWRTGDAAIELRNALEQALGGERTLLSTGQLERAEVSRLVVRGSLLALGIGGVCVAPGIAAGNGLGPVGVLGAMGTAALAAVGVLVAARLLDRARGRADFYPSKIAIARWRETVVAWSDLKGYTDSSADSIQLVRVKDLWPHDDLAVPTATEEERTAVLALLDARGLKRIE